MKEELKVQRVLNSTLREFDSEGESELNLKVSPPSIEKVRGSTSPILLDKFPLFHEIERQQNFVKSIEKV